MAGVFAGVGKAGSDWARELDGKLAFLGEALVCLLRLPFRPREFRFGDFWLAFQRASFDGLPISTGIGFLLGVILAFQATAAMQQFGVAIYVSDLLAIAIYRELGPLVTAIILAGRSGSAFAAEIGTMKVNEELDALTTMGLPPVRFLVMPRVMAGMLAMPVLTIFAEIAAMVGGVLVMQLMDVPPEMFWRHVMSVTTQFMILFGLGKGALFGLLVGLIGCSAGMRTKSTADGVGVSATAAVVGSIVAIAVTDGVLAVLCYIWKI